MNTAHPWTCVVTAAGHAQRFRPFSAVVPKEMLPLGARPALEHVIAECHDAGATRVLVATRPGDHIVPTYLELLRERDIPVEAVTEDLAHGYGNGTPLLTLRDRLRAETTFGVAFGDDVLLGGRDLAAMHALADDGADAVLAAQLVERADIASFGVVDTHPQRPDQVTGIRQRPDPATVTEPLAVVSRLVLRPTILDRLAPSEHARGEVDLGVAVGALARDADVRVHRIEGSWVTVGDPRRYRDALNAHERFLTAESSRGERLCP
ncbi:MULTISPECIES: sugar phosphate nucleotidyltransferase [Actinosynnema]|uniref:sugar phosphate nucleotidyltransferase n=1 Tax=Actinosynnema TaxID=40566 RepID=UPI0020A37059|nr:sugar phosphate nucleotidyltransferase [Actinosynnema pretiosum]MCP2094720.1 UTP--glucose-1-phosphate uridylyltransferase [Actinosynnema pretiosum]